MKSHVLGIATVFGFLSISAAGCAAEPQESEPISAARDGEQAVLAEGAVALNSAQVADATVGADRIVFPSPDETVRNLKPGVTISSIAQGKAFIRTVITVVPDTSVGPNAVVVTTQDGSLSDLARQVKTQKHLTLPEVSVDFSGTRLAGDDKGNVACSKCFIKYAPTLDFGMNVQRRRVDYFSAEFDGELTANLTLAASAFEGVKLGQEIEIAHATAHLVQAIGPVPIWEDVTVSVSVGFSGSLGPKTTLETGVGATKRVHGGVVYDGQDWTSLHDGEVTFTHEAPTLKFDVGAKGKVYLKPKIQVKLYSLAGPYLAAEAYAAFDAHVCPPPAVWSTKAGFNVGVGASLNFLKYVNISMEKELYKKEIDLAGGDLPIRDLPCSPIEVIPE